MSLGHEQYSDLLEEFPELAGEETLLSKEVLAHFGLLFSAFALLEAALHNLYVFWTLKCEVARGAIRDHHTWRSRLDELEARAFESTFGTLLKLLSDCSDVSGLMAKLGSLKGSRDYFAHHFFREENSKMFSDDTQLAMIARMNVLRRRVKEAEVEVGRVGDSIISDLYPGLDVDAATRAEMQRIKESSGGAQGLKFGWEDSS